MSYLEELLPDFRKGAKIRLPDWEKGEYICMKDGVVVDEDGTYQSELYCFYFTSAEWELYQEPIDYDYIIENKCLCWFWDKSTSKCIGLLKQYGRGQESFFVWQDEDENTACFENCRPVRRDEVTFYEDKEND